ncbi:MAG: hypothetical protein AAF928_22060 [Myxococcota bacterium]
MVKTRPWNFPAAMVLAAASWHCGEAESENGAPDENANGATTSGGGTSPPPPDADDRTLDFDDPTSDPPALRPELVALTYIGGAGDQYTESVAFDADGGVTVSGTGWTLRWTAAELAAAANDGASAGTLDGDVATEGGVATEGRPSLPGAPGRAYDDPRIGLTFTVGYRQAGNLQMPIFRAFEDDVRVWALWGHAVADAQDASLGADTRCYRAWGMPFGRIGVMCWTDGGNSVLARDPRNLMTDPGWTDGAWQRSAGGMSSLLALVDPSDGGRVVSGTFMAAHVGHLTVDAWGRVYMGRVARSRDGGDDPSDTFGVGAETGASGVLILDEGLQRPLFNARLGGTCEDGAQHFNALAVHDGILVMGGTTCAADLGTIHAVQPTPGGGQDAMVAVVRLW